jgi:threonine/homoserine/homoserine lactone efflux protein
MSAVKILPLAIVMIAGPQILSAIFLATSQGWKRNSAAYILGAAVSISLVVTAAYLLGEGASDEGASNDTLYVVILVLLVAAALHTFLTRKKAKDPPKWMGRLQTAQPRFSFRLGFLLLGVFPTDILTSLAVGGYLVSQEAPLWNFLPFLGLTLFLLAVPALLIVAMGERAQTFLPRLRDWMDENAWVVNEVVIVFFIALTINNLT